MVASDALEGLSKNVLELSTGCFKFVWSRAVGSLSSTRTVSVCSFFRDKLLNEINFVGSL